MVRLDGRAFADEGGAWNALGASLFWALWGERHDAARLDANLAYLASHSVDYVRILGMVGSESWADRAIDPEAGDYWDTVDRLFARLARHGLRAHVTIFADAQVMMPDPPARDAFVRAWADRVNRHADRVLLVEVVNEHYQNGLDAASTRRYGDLLRSLTKIPVALSAPSHDNLTEFYAGWTGVATLHYDRDTSTPAGAWQPVWQPWTASAPLTTLDTARRPAAFVNSEPIGPGASVAADDDPLRIAMAYATTFVAGNAAYTYHAGAGVRGGGREDVRRGRRANIQDEPTAVIDALAQMKRTLPPGLANWTRHDASAAEFPWDGSQAAITRGDILRAYATSRDGQFVAVILGIRAPHTITAKRAMSLRLVHPLDGKVIDEVTLEAGQTWTIRAGSPAYVVRASQK